MLDRLRAEWDRFATRARLRALPAVPAVVAVLAIGVLVPLFAGGAARPPSLTTSLAAERLERFLESRDAWPAGDVAVPRPEVVWRPLPRAVSYAVALDGKTAATGEPRWRPGDDLAPGAYRVRVVGRDAAGAEVGARETAFTVVEALPRGDVHTSRPAFHWRPVEGARAYRVRLLRADGTLTLERTEREPRSHVRPPAGLRPGEYRLEVHAAGAPPRTAEFRVLPAASPQDARVVLPAAEAALVRAGWHAARGSAPEVVAALEAYLDLPGADRRELALRVLSRCGAR